MKESKGKMMRGIYGLLQDCLLHRSTAWARHQAWGQGKAKPGRRCHPVDGGQNQVWWGKTGPGAALRCRAWLWGNEQFYQDGWGTCPGRAALWGV